MTKIEKQKKDNANKLGAEGENLAAQFLRNKGYKISRRNLSSRYGEIDIVAEKDAFVIFIEVKTRSSDFFHSPATAVNIHKQRKIIKTALMYIQEKDINLQPRFDIIEVVMKNEGYNINHIESAFESEGFYSGF